MKRITASLRHFLQAVASLVEGTIGSNGTGRALFATWGPVSIDPHPGHRYR
jgi:hypothetical protein